MRRSLNILIITILSISVLFAEKNKKKNKAYFYAAYNRSSLIELSNFMASFSDDVESIYKIKPQSRLQIGLKKKMGSWILGTGMSRRGGIIKRDEVQETETDLDGNQISFQVFPAATIIYYITNIDVFFRYPYKSVRKAN